MKKKLFITFIAASLLALSACGNNTTTETTVSESETSLANPMVEVSDAAEFEEKLSISLDTSYLSEYEYKMFIIGEKVMDVSFDLDNVNGDKVSYNLRATKDSELAQNLSGYYGEIASSNTIDYDYITITQDTYEDITADGNDVNVYTFTANDVFYSLSIEGVYSQMQYGAVMDSVLMALGIE